eukprot:TRINITY_DN5750_c0_g2_i1.p1 TRINITY_DN5750_c0_g2~~TRINITY_DN5750_c0_g2_i1.p1  ORF type:complete len:925 (+),score=156.21 TRINITY_DN5750_c0_g2_i1:39-2813(+)
MSVDLSQYQDAMQLLTREANCERLDMERRTEFARVWIYSAIYGAAVVLIITVPFYWRRSRRMELAAVSPETPGALDKAKKRNRRSLEDAKRQEIDFEAAKRNLLWTSATEDDRWKNPLTTDISEISMIGGSGTELYFRSLRNLGFVFAYKSALTLPTCFFCLLGNFSPDTGHFLLKTTISNLGRFVPTSLLDPTHRLISAGCQGALLEDITPFFAWLDFTAIFIFLVYAVWFRFFRIPSIDKRDNLEQVTVSDFAVVIDCLPGVIENHKEYAKLLEAHIVSRIKDARRCQKQPSSTDIRVHELTLVRNYEGRLISLMDRAHLAQNIQIQQAHGREKKVEKLSQKLRQLDGKLSKSVALDEDLPVFRAYAILNTSADVDSLLHDYRFAEFGLFRLCQFHSRRFEGWGIRVRRAPEPTTLIWENQDCPSCRRLLRKGVVMLIFIIVLIMSLVAIYLTTAYNAMMSQVNLTYIGHLTCDPVAPRGETTDEYRCEVGNVANWTQENATATGGAVLNCWCTAQGFTKLMNDGSLQEACRPWLVSLASSIGLNTAASTVTLGINVAVQSLLIYLSKLEKHNSVTALNSSLMQKVAWAQTINTGFLLLAVNIYGPQSLRDFAATIPGIGSLIFKGPFDDLTRGWYAVVGVTILTNMLLNAIVPPAVTLGQMLLTVLRRCCFSSGARHQAELIGLYTNPEFDIKGKYAQMLTTVFVTLTYSAGLPMLNGFAFLYFLLMYWADKFCLLWGSKRPPYYDTTMATEASEAMLYAVALHCVFAVWMLSQPCVFPTKPIGSAFGELAESISPAAVQSFSSRMIQETTWMFTALFAVLVAAWVLWWVLWLLDSTFGSVRDIIADIYFAEAEKSYAAEAVDEACGVEWDQAAVCIESKNPPASFRMERHPDMISFAHLLRGEAGEAEKGVRVPEKAGES